MDLQITNWPFTELSLFATQAQQILQYPHLMQCILLDLQRLEETIVLEGGEKALRGSLSSTEQELLNKFKLAKRRREWLGGRLAAKYAVDRLLELVQSRQYALPWADYSILGDDYGRPHISADCKTGAPMPDISISHSGSFAAALAVRKGFGGLDLQEITPKILKVKDRFCTPGEERILRDSIPVAPANIAGLLTKLWSAKEALRKVARLQTLPGFLEMKLVEINCGQRQDKNTPWCFIFTIEPSAGFTRKGLNVAVIGMENYTLAVTAMDDTLI